MLFIVQIDNFRNDHAKQANIITYNFDTINRTVWMKLINFIKLGNIYIQRVYVYIYIFVLGVILIRI